MSHSLQEHFRCPDSVASRFRVQEPADTEPGFFRFGADVVCFGRTSAVRVSNSYLDQLGDSSAFVRVADGEVSLPFDPDQITANLRNEVYTRQMEPDITRLGSHPTIRAIYYLGRPLLPVQMRSVLQRFYLRGETANPFPVWPVDRTVETLFEKMLKLAIESAGGQPVPFIWFWPDGAQAAFILTHDVETGAGRDFALPLMDMDESYGFKAAFQFIPEKRYELSPDFLQTFKNRGFEVNVHDLNHDGNLFRERSEFLERAEKINAYVREFGSEGFRSGALYRNLLWYDAFRFSYDMSVPNVGHLDPQGGGCCTTFPYFIGDVLEIPVTCTQDYSLFHILNQYSINLWRQQFEKISSGHGLISIIVHPDYVTEPRAQHTYGELLQFLQQQFACHHVWATLPREINRWWRQRRSMRIVESGKTWAIEGPGSERARIAYAHLANGKLAFSFDPVLSEAAIPGAARTALAEKIVGPPACEPRGQQRDWSPGVAPVEVSARDASSAEFSSTAAAELAVQPVSAPAVSPGRGQVLAATPKARPLRVAMVTYSFYEADNRVMRYAETLAKRGDQVEIFALSRDGKPAEEIINGVQVYRIQGRVLNEKSQVSYAWRILQFLLRATFHVGWQDLKARYDLLHIHSVPDFMVFSALVPRLRGTPVILDIHDILPEFYASKFTTNAKSGTFKFLLGIERCSAKFASHVIVANHLWQERLISRSVPAGKCTVVLNSPDRSIFTRSVPPGKPSGRFILLYPGSLNWHQGLDIAIRAFARISSQVPEAEFHIYGDGPSKGDLLELSRELGLNGRVVMPSAKPLREIARIMETADLGIVPKRKNTFGNEAFSTKILEFMAMGVPVIVPDTRVDRYYFNDSVVQFFRGGEEEDLANCMLELIKDPGRRKRQAENASRFVETVDWNAKQGEYLNLLDTLVKERR